MPLFQTPVLAGVVSHPLAFGGSTAQALTAGAAYLSQITLDEAAIITQMRCSITTGSPTGNVDMGIYDATGTNNAPNNRLASTGAIAAATGNFTKSLTATLYLAPGVYWLAVMMTVANSVYVRQSASAGLGPAVITSATNLTVLPNPLGGVSNNINLINLWALSQNGWS